MLGVDNRLIWLQLSVAAVLAGSYVVLPGAATAADLRPADSPGLRPARTLDLAGGRLGSDVSGFSVAAATRRNSHAPPRMPKHSGRRESYADHKSARARSHRRQFIIGPYSPKKTLPCPSGMTLNARRKCVAWFKLDYDI